MEIPSSLKKHEKWAVNVPQPTNSCQPDPFNSGKWSCSGRVLLAFPAMVSDAEESLNRRNWTEERWERDAELGGGRTPPLGPPVPEQTLTVHGQGCSPRPRAGPHTVWVDSDHRYGQSQKMT